MWLALSPIRRSSGSDCLAEGGFIQARKGFASTGDKMGVYRSDKGLVWRGLTIYQGKLAGDYYSFYSSLV